MPVTRDVTPHICATCICGYFDLVNGKKEWRCTRLQPGEQAKPCYNWNISPDEDPDYLTEPP